MVQYLGPVLQPVATLFIVLLLAAFILASREDLRNRVVRLAGLRVGYAIARPETIHGMQPYRLEISVNTLAAVAAKASLAAAAHLQHECELNRAARAFTRQFFEREGFRVSQSETNFLMVEIRRPVDEFRKACADGGVAIGRSFPPLLSHARISIGTMNEMEKAVGVFRTVLTSRAAG